MVFGEATFDGKLVMLALVVGEADLASFKDGDDGGVVFEQGEGPLLAWHGDGSGFALEQGIGW